MKAKEIFLNEEQIKENVLIKFFQESNMENFLEVMNSISDRIETTEEENNDYFVLHIEFTGWNGYKHKYKAIWRVNAHNNHGQDWQVATKYNKVLIEENTQFFGDKVLFRATQEIYNWVPNEDGMILDNKLFHGI